MKRVCRSDIYTWEEQKEYISMFFAFKNVDIYRYIDILIRDLLTRLISRDMNFDDGINFIKKEVETNPWFTNIKDFADIQIEGKQVSLITKYGIRNIKEKNLYKILYYTDKWIVNN